jgi:bile acid:Na+ symporter, BASS family
VRGALGGGLARIGDLGLFAPPLAFLLGLALPPLAMLGQVGLVPCVIVLLAMSVGLAEPGRIEARECPPVLLLAVCNLIATPVLVHLFTQASGLAAAAGGWLVLVAACPAAGGAALVASLLRLPVRPLLLAQLLCFFALPITAPLVAGMVLDGAAISAQALLGRVMLMVGMPALLGYALRRVLGERRRVILERPMRGLGVLALCGIALSIAAGLPGLELPALAWREALLGLLLASVMGGALGLLAAGVIAPGLWAGFALGGAVRNVSLLWSATLGLAPPEGQLLMMLGTLWTLVLPALLGLRLEARLRRALAVALLALALL